MRGARSRMKVFILPLSSGLPGSRSVFHRPFVFIGENQIESRGIEEKKGSEGDEGLTSQRHDPAGLEVPPPGAEVVDEE